MNYLAFEPEDFANDSFFIRWVKEADEETETFWQNWLQTYPHKIQQVALARQLVILITNDHDEEPSELVVRQMWDRIQVGRQQDGIVISHPARSWPVKWIRSIAATITLLLLTTGGYYFWQNRQVSYQTGYGESRRVKLPDGSLVDLNANSTLTTTANWQTDRNREVWLSGEAFFTVSKQKRLGTLTKFTVHTTDLDVEVKGTQFDVSTRQAKTKVVLTEGNVQLLLRDHPTRDALRMKPGDAVVFSREKQHITVNHVANPEATHSWTHSRWTLEDTSLQEVATLLEETYGIRVYIADKALLNLKVNGVIPTNNLTDLLNTLESILPIKIDRQADQLTIRPLS